MKQKIFFWTVLVLIIMGCNTQNKVDNNVNELKGKMEVLIDSAIVQFNSGYKIALDYETDSIRRQKIKNLNYTILTTNNYLDSLILEMNKLDYMNLQNVELVNNIFINGQLGDSVFNKLNSCYNTAIEITRNEKIKSEIKQSKSDMLGEGNVNDFNKNLFSANNPLGVSMILNGFQLEILEIGIKSIQNTSHLAQVKR